MLKHHIRRILPSSVIRHLNPLWVKYKAAKFRRQKSSQHKLYGFTLVLPENHPLPELIAAQPYRDLCIGIMAKHLAQKYPSKSIIDIGANIGDTAALIAHHCKNRLILIEGSDYFFSYLVKNVAQIGNDHELRNILISDGQAISADLQHWGGTAELKETKDGLRMETVRLGDVTSDNVCFIKSDTDGHDFKILASATEWLATQRPALLFESQIRNAEDLAAGNSLLGELAKVGYEYFMVWDDAGYHMLSTSDHLGVAGLHRYLLKLKDSGGGGNISNLDVACFHADDREVFDALSRWWASY